MKAKEDFQFFIVITPGENENTVQWIQGTGIHFQFFIVITTRARLHGMEGNTKLSILYCYYHLMLLA